MTLTQESHGTPKGYKSGCRCDSCVEFRREYDRAYYERNKAKRKAQVVTWQRANREKVRAINASVKTRDPAAYLAKARVRAAKSRAINPDAHKERERRYLATEKGRLKRALSNTRRRNAICDEFTDETIALLLNDPCCYCGGPGGSIDHILPLAAGGTSESHNLTASCLSCNASKCDTDLLGFLSRR